MSETIDHKKAAMSWVDAAVSEYEVRRTESSALAASASQTHALLALVEAQEEANRIAERAVEQQRIANLAALAFPADGDRTGSLDAKRALGGTSASPMFYGFAPDVAAALGIPTDGGES